MRVQIAKRHGIDALVYGVFWCRGKRVFETALDLGFLGSTEGRDMEFAVMWANRLPRRVLPVRRTDLPVIEDGRRVASDVEDFVTFVATMADEYFCQSNYAKVDGHPYLSIFDSTYFLQELGIEAAGLAVRGARQAVRDRGHAGLHLAAVDPAPHVIGDLSTLGFDSVTHYVHLPEWKGPFLQDYAEAAARRAAEWPRFAATSDLPYMPSVAPGWDATPRGADFGPKRPDKYPWSPVVTGEHPDRFHTALRRAVRHVRGTWADEHGFVFVSSLNEWSEGHYLEPDERFGYAWLEAVRSAR